MKVLKFGGTSVGTIESLRNVKKIVEANEDSVIVVVSALGGLTDRLIESARKAESGDASFRSDIEEMKRRHTEIIEALVAEDSRKPLSEEVEALFDQLERTYTGIFMLEELSCRSLDKVVSFGERLSSRIVSKIIANAVLFDSLTFIKTLRRFDRHMLDNDRSIQLIQSAFGERSFKTAVVPGFISTDNNGIITNLGRGGSDYTAAILAAALNASSLEIWTDVDGFMTADPRLIKNAKVIPALSFTEAMELCNFGAKVIYPPTIYPVFNKNIPIFIKNTFNPAAPGTKIHDVRKPDNKTTEAKGVTSLAETSLLTIQSSENIRSRILDILSRNGVSVLLATRVDDNCRSSYSIASSEVEIAKNALETEFHAEIETGEMASICVEKDLSTIAIVADDMKSDKEIPFRISKTIESSDLDIRAWTATNPETSISLVVRSSDRCRTLELIHDEFFS
ncbi:MAG: aspartate kinase [Paramuribaculum sp.]|nr:aspartate kinase [Paramuribaculum sp.]